VIQAESAALYNAGPRRFKDHLRRGTALPVETLTYLTDIDPSIVGSIASEDLSRHTAPAVAETVHAPQISSGTTLFFPLGTVSIVFAAAAQGTSSSLFVPLGNSLIAAPSTGKSP